MNSFNDLMNDEVTIKTQTKDTKGYGDMIDDTSVTYCARVVEVYISIQNRVGNIVYPEYKIFLTKDVPDSIDDNSIITYNSEDYHIEKKQAIRNEKGKIVSWVIFI